MWTVPSQWQSRDVDIGDTLLFIKIRRNFTPLLWCFPPHILHLTFFSGLHCRQCSLSALWFPLSMWQISPVFHLENFTYFLLKLCFDVIFFLLSGLESLLLLLSLSFTLPDKNKYSTGNIVSNIITATYGARCVLDLWGWSLYKVYKYLDTWNLCNIICQLQLKNKSFLKI